MDKLEEIKKKYKSPNENIGWLISEIERLREALTDIHFITHSQRVRMIASQVLKDIDISDLSHNKH